MKKQLFADTAPDRREAYLRDTCYKVLENESYTRRLETDEVTERKTTLFERVRKINELAEELKEISKTFKEQIKELDDEKKTLIQEIQFESVSEKGNLYAIDDQESGMMNMYDKYGVWVSARPLRADERQTSILTIKRNGTED